MPTDGSPTAETPHAAEPPPRRASLLQQYLNAHGISSASVEREAKTTRQQMYRWRRRPGEDILRTNMVRVLGAVRKLSRNPSVRMEELFDLDPENPENWKN